MVNNSRLHDTNSYCVPNEIKDFYRPNVYKRAISDYKNKNTLQSKAELDIEGFRTKNFLYEDNPHTHFGLHTEIIYCMKVKTYLKNHKHVLRITNGEGTLDFKNDRIGGGYTPGEVNYR